MKKVMVTGGAGFIGSHLAEELARRGYHVIILDDLSTGKIENIRMLTDSPPQSHSPCHSERSEESQGGGNNDNPNTHPRAQFVHGSVTDLPLLQELSQDVRYVFHQAAIPSVPRGIENPLASHEANVTGTLNVLLAARDNNVKKVIYASSSSVYGDTPTLPKREDMPLNPQSPYAVSKLAAEYYCSAFREVYGLSSVCLRYFNVYGPGQDPDSPYAAVVPRFIRRVCEGTPPIVFGDGEQTRDFVYVKDVVNANVFFAEAKGTGVFNIGTGTSVSINQLARLIINIMRQELEPVHEKPRPGEITHSRADISRGGSFGYNPKHDLQAGLQATVAAGMQQEHPNAKRFLQ